jgi:hypothetical protein
MITPGVDESFLVWEADKTTGEKTLVVCFCVMWLD